MLLKLKVNLCACQYIRTKKMSRTTKCRQKVKNPLYTYHISIKANINLITQTLKKTHFYSNSCTHLIQTAKNKQITKY